MSVNLLLPPGQTLSERSQEPPSGCGPLEQGPAAPKEALPCSGLSDISVPRGMWENTQAAAGAAVRQCQECPWPWLQLWPQQVRPGLWARLSVSPPPLDTHKHPRLGPPTWPLSTPPARPEALEAVGTGQSQSDRKQPLTCPPNSAFSVRLTGHMMAAHGLTTGEGASPETAGPRRAASPHCLSLGTGHNKAPPSCPWAPSGIPSCLSLPHLPQSLPSQSPYC